MSVVADDSSTCELFKLMSKAPSYLTFSSFQQTELNTMRGVCSQTSVVTCLSHPECSARINPPLFTAHFRVTGCYCVYGSAPSSIIVHFRRNASESQFRLMSQIKLLQNIREKILPLVYQSLYYEYQLLSSAGHIS